MPFEYNEANIIEVTTQLFCCFVIVVLYCSMWSISCVWRLGGGGGGGGGGDGGDGNVGGQSESDGGGDDNGECVGDGGEGKASIVPNPAPVRVLPTFGFL